MLHTDLRFALLRVCAALCLALLSTCSASGASKFRVLHSFHCDPSGCGPIGGLVFDAAGNLYGTTSGGGDADATVFGLSPLSGDRWTYSLLYTLTIKQGSELVAALTLDPAGNLYGTADYGGAHDFGSVFELSPDQTTTEAWTLTVLHSFDPFVNDGSGPWDKVILDKAGNVYGTTREGGPAGGGVIFELAQGSGGGWTEDILYGFTLKSGGEPYGELIFDEAGKPLRHRLLGRRPALLLRHDLRIAAHLHGLERDHAAPLPGPRR